MRKIFLQLLKGKITTGQVKKICLKILEKRCYSPSASVRASVSKSIEVLDKVISEVKNEIITAGEAIEELLPE